MRAGISNFARHGFTLIELIAVTAVAIVSAGLLLPAFITGNHQATAGCMNNTRLLAMAAQMYAADNRDLWPANGQSDQTINFANVPVNYIPRVWIEGRVGVNLNTEENARASISEKVSLLGKYLTEPEVLRCPLDRALLRLGSALHRRPRSYGLNTFIGWTPDRFTGVIYHGEPNSSSRVFRTVSATPTPGNIFLFGEIHPYSICQPMFGSHPRWDSAGNPTGENRTYHIPASYHGNASVFSMADGHVEAHKWVHPRFNDPYLDGKPMSEGNTLWHNHNAPLQGVLDEEVATDFKWLSLHATVPR